MVVETSRLNLSPAKGLKMTQNYTPEYRRNQALVPHNPKAVQKLPDQLKMALEVDNENTNNTGYQEHTLVVVETTQKTHQNQAFKWNLGRGPKKQFQPTSFSR